MSRPLPQPDALGHSGKSRPDLLFTKVHVLFAQLHKPHVIGRCLFNEAEEERSEFTIHHLTRHHADHCRLNVIAVFEDGPFQIRVINPGSGFQVGVIIPVNRDHIGPCPDPDIPEPRKHGVFHQTVENAALNCRV